MKILENRKFGYIKVPCQFCSKEITKFNIKRHEKACNLNPNITSKGIKTCPVCQTNFSTRSTTCSYSCSNTYFRHGKEGGLRYVDDQTLIDAGRYRDICFRYHGKTCIICNEDKIVSVHHLNGVHNDNRPENLIPMCPTHHQYCHSRYSHLIQKQIDEYVSKMKIDILK